MAFCTLSYQFCVGAFPGNCACNDDVKHYSERFAHSTFNQLVLLLTTGTSGTFDATFWVQQDCCRHFARCHLHFVLVRSLEILLARMPPSTTTRDWLTQLFNLLVLLLIASASGTVDATFWVQQDCCWHFGRCDINFASARSLKNLFATMPPSPTMRD